MIDDESKVCKLYTYCKTNVENKALGYLHSVNSAAVHITISRDLVTADLYCKQWSDLPSTQRERCMC